MRWLPFALVLVARLAFAQAPGETPPLPEQDDQKAVWAGYMWSLAATTAPLTVGIALDPDNDHKTYRTLADVMLVGGLTLGPSAGHWYAGEGVTPGLALRVGAAAAIAGLAMWDPHLDHGAITIGGLMLAAHAWIGGLAWDLATIPRSVRHYNRAHQHQLTPVITGNGVAIAGRF